jgi:DNA-binding GntR family transcriptional regulator
LSDNLNHTRAFKNLRMRRAKITSMSTSTTASPARAVIHRLVEGLTSAITQGLLLPGQRLVEADLQHEYGVGRSSVREALQMLQAAGLVVIEANKGAAVRSLEAREIDELFAIREQLEGLAARLAALALQQGSQADRKAVQQLLVRMERQSRQTDAQAYNLLNREFHNLLLHLSGNAQLQLIVAQLNMPILVHQFRGFMQPNNQQASHADHVRIAQAVLAGEAAQAQRLMQKHVRSGLKLVQRWAAQAA